ncbi:glycoside hydrolase family 16 protein [Peniophora sp. CONT]|nr:glycoside hydrolase family 16 protein [Peniophora sp. CONT]
MRNILSLTLSFPLFALAGNYSLSDNYQGNDFIDKFDFFSDDDPTHGFVNYVNSTVAKNNDLVQVSGTNFTMRADDQNVPAASGRGRDSVRITSQKAYNTHVAVFNVAHMPTGCGTWPAIWEVEGGNWPLGGEVDIVEGVNTATQNTVSLHTGPNCSVPPVRTAMTGNPTNNNCDSSKGDNSGCNVELTPEDNFGPSFNSNGGGFYAMERTNEMISVWFWSRDDDNIPNDVFNGLDTVDTTTWGTAAALFPNNQCNIEESFGAHNIVINLTFCGDLAGSQYGQAGCPGSCNDFVRNNPEAFSDAMFQIMWAKVYE